MFYFDLHVHPSTKGSLTFDLIRYNAWSNIRLFRTFFGILKRFRQIIDSQANLTQIERAPVLSVVAFVAIEKAFARNYVINKILASRIVSPLDRTLLNDVLCDRRSYFQMFNRDLCHLYNAQSIKRFNILTRYQNPLPDGVNVILSIEGAHCFQDKDESSIIENFKLLKQDARYRFHHLTLTHLTRQPACVHCFGVKIKIIKDLSPDINFRPDPGKKGISPIGESIIKTAYENETNAKRILIDLKHMSYLSRMQFYEMRKGKWDEIPLIVSHAGVTGCSLKNAMIKKINKGATPSDCDEVHWCRVKTAIGTYFNPWTINLFDEDIERVIESKGLIGISLDERILGFGKIYGEYMSKIEVEELKLVETDPNNIPDDCQVQKLITDEEKIFAGFEQDRETLDILAYEEQEEERFKTLDNLGGDLLFDLDERENAEEEEELRRSGSSHIDYLACNILHVVKVGIREHPYSEVVRCICLGSDLDGLVDAMNFPGILRSNPINQKDWLMTHKYDHLRSELASSIGKCIQNDSNLAKLNIDINDLVNRVMCTNGPDFLKANFT